MAYLRRVAFALGGIGLALFLAGIVWAAVVQPPCGRATCPSWDTSKLFVNIMFLWGGGLALEMVAVAFLFLHARDRRNRPAPKGRVVAAAPSSPTVLVTRRPPERPRY